jgi:hypothetical protein
MVLSYINLNFVLLLWLIFATILIVVRNNSKQ